MSRSIDSFEISRRRFGALAGAAGLSMGLGSRLVSPAFAEAVADSAEIIQGKVPGLLVHNAKLGVMETPLTLLRKYAHTPKEILFCRFHFPHEGNAAWYATTAAPDRKDWTIRVDGLVQRPRDVTLADLEKMGQEKRVSVIQCAGNGRSYYAARQKVAGGQWKNGGMGNVKWEGVPLRPFLDELKMVPSSEATWLTAEGWDQPATPEGTDFAKSYHLDDPALDHAIIALKMNGEPIPACHGGPVRLIIPGYYGNMNVKLLSGLLFAAAQSPSAYQSLGYRMPIMPVEPGKFGANDYTLSNSVPTYGHTIKSVIFSPLPDDNPKAGAVEITGVAFNDGVAPITSVEVSADGGKSWQNAEIETPESPWAWHHWSAKASLAKGAAVLMSRATDALGRTQPIDGLARWNPRGYEWNGVERLELTVA
ncbi:sulfite dehydrogenase (cytochrome) subunit SorA apoprotein [Tistlia consotensis]|uniref:Sulfite dehydrogenase (Cytochrome) subunit SorA apoprotein n=1 Tax=Tistlia consotensis USBA 355 TaxID=560819 RepID=A0A1Y6CJ04_9PROT|nr:molybdopterin-dependent oxidoreductase [Tistlia consotensis]SMF68929.1 sulfite dehydrogenase (cytochrome) subunit SorA apoprotein [Tistlia consotensis USBA 355]SNS01626.1 sulfite dehydrogenase (cytochrome) subunit SorA apoprotein [Tistlia consotensis]